MNPDDDFEDTTSGDVLMLTVPAEKAGDRLDRFLAEQADGLSRTRLQALIREGAVFVGEEAAASPSQKVAAGGIITVNVPPPVDYAPAPENISLNIVYEDADMLVIDKQAGLVVHPGAGNHSGTLVNALLYHCGNTLSGIGGVLRPGIVHRLDKDTSGLMVAAKSDRAHRGLARQLEDRTLSRRYRAVVWKTPPLRAGTVDQPIGRHPGHRQKMTALRQGGRHAVTHYAVESFFGADKKTAALVTCTLETGRTHQVRVHMAHIGHPLIGDPLYGLQSNAARSLLKKGGYDETSASRIMAFPRQALHAWQIGFIHPVSGEAMAFESSLPDDLDRLINLFKSIS